MNGIRVVILLELPENVPTISGEVAVDMLKSGTCKGGWLINSKVTEWALD